MAQLQLQDSQSKLQIWYTEEKDDNTTEESGTFKPESHVHIKETKPEKDAITIWSHTWPDAHFFKNILDMSWAWAKHELMKHSLC